MKKKILQLLGMVLFVGLLAGCGSNNEKTVVFSDAGWDSVKFHNAVAGLIAEKAYGLKVETMNGSTPIMEAALVRGDVDVNMELWTDNVATYQADKAAGGIVDLGINFDDNKQGLVIPSVALRRWRLICTRFLIWPATVNFLWMKKILPKGVFTEPSPVGRSMK